jgi:hypothetical protein
MEKHGVWGIKSLLLLSYLVTAVAVTGQIGALTLLGWEITDGIFWGGVVSVIAPLMALLGWRSFWVVTYAQAKQDWDAKATTRPAAGEESLKVKQAIHVTTDGLASAATAQSPL